jgi:hypothetical protein
VRASFADYKQIRFKIPVHYATLPAGYPAVLVASIEEAFDHLGNHIDIIGRHIRIDPCGGGAACVASHETAWRIVLPTESLGDALAARSGMF